MVGAFALGVFVLGWIGALLILVSFALLINKKIDSHSSAYLWMNLLGGVFLACDGLSHGSYSSGAVNVIWALIAAMGIVQAGITLKKRKR